MTGLQSTPAEHDPKILPEVLQTPQRSDNLYAQTSPSHLPEVHYGQDDNIAQNNSLSQEHATYVKDKETANDTATGQRKFCGLRRRVAIGLIIAIVLVAAVVGGAVGGILGTKSRKTGASTQNEPTPSPAPSDPPGSTNTSDTAVPALEPMRSIMTTQSKGTIFNIWQKANGELWMHAYYRARSDATNGAQKWTDPMKLGDDILAINNTPIATATWQASNRFEIHIHFQAQSSPTLSSIELFCNANGTSCDPPTIKPISNSTTLTPGAGFFMLSPAANTLRYYTINSDGLVSEASYDSKARDWRAARAISNTAKAHKSSPIAAGIVNGEIWLFWFDEAKRLQSATSVWSSQTWSQVQTISTYTIPAQLPRALGIAVSDAPQAVQVFFFDGTKMQQVRYSNSKWMAGDVGSSIPDASISNGPMGVVGWNDTGIRMYYPVGQDRAIKELIAEGGNGVWKVGGAVNDGYD